MPCKSASPGPAYGLPTLTGYENHDFTKNRAPAYSMGARTGGGPSWKTPGPYKVENCDRRGRYPYQGWTLGARNPAKPPIRGPAPNSYAPEKWRPYKPAWSLGLKCDTRTRQVGPSPAEYFPGKDKPGGWSIAGRLPGPPGPGTPGPGAPPNLDAYKYKPPAFSLGLQTGGTQYKTPGPGPCYLPKKCICKEPQHSYSFGLKHTDCSPPMITYDDQC